MTTHEAIQAQARAQLLEHRGTPAVIVEPSGVRTPVTAICGPVEDELTQDGRERTERELMRVEIPKLPSEGGIAAVPFTASVVIEGVEWGVKRLDRGAPGMHYVELVRASRAQQAGRRVGR